MITQSAEEFMEKEAFLGAALSMGRALLPGIKTGLGAMTSQVGNIAKNFGKATVAAGKAVTTPGKKPFKARITSSTGVFGKNLNVNRGVSTSGIVASRNLRSVGKSVGGIGAGAYLGNKMPNAQQAQQAQQAQLPQHYQQAQLPQHYQQGYN